MADKMVSVGCISVEVKSVEIEAMPVSGSVGAGGITHDDRV